MRNPVLKSSDLDGRFLARVRYIDRSMLGRWFAAFVLMLFAALASAANASGPCEGALHSPLYRLLESALRTHRLAVTDVQSVVDSVKPRNPFSGKAIEPRDVALANALLALFADPSVESQWSAMREELARLLESSAEKHLETAAVRLGTAAILRAELFARIDRGAKPNVTQLWDFKDASGVNLAVQFESFRSDGVEILNLDSGGSNTVDLNHYRKYATNVDSELILAHSNFGHDKRMLDFKKIDGNGNEHSLGDVKVSVAEDFKARKVYFRKYAPGRILVVMSDRTTGLVFDVDLNLRTSTELSSIRGPSDKSISSVDFEISGDGTVYLISKAFLGESRVYRIVNGQIDRIAESSTSSEKLKVHRLSDGRIWLSTLTWQKLEVKQIWPDEKSVLSLGRRQLPEGGANGVTDVEVLFTASGRQLFTLKRSRGQELLFLESDSTSSPSFSRLAVTAGKPSGKPSLVTMPDGREYLAVMIENVGVQLFDFEARTPLFTINTGQKVESMLWTKNSAGVPFLAVRSDKSVLVYRLWSPEQ